MKHMNKGSKTLSDIELDSLLANPPLPADRGFSSRIENHVARELRRLEGCFWQLAPLGFLSLQLYFLNISPRFFRW
jgi:hypothetical protein